MQMMGGAWGLRIRLDGEWSGSQVCLRGADLCDYRSGLVAYHILQSGANCRLPKTPKSESSVLESFQLADALRSQLRGAWPTIISMYVSERNERL